MRSLLYLIMRSVLVLAVLLAAEAVDELKEPGELALELDEDQFEDYLDKWLAQERYRHISQASPSSAGCTFKINEDLGQPQPVFLRYDTRRGVGRYLAAQGNNGQIHLEKGEPVTVACPGRAIRNIATTTKKARVEAKEVAKVNCVKNKLVSGDGWLNGNTISFDKLVCSEHLRPQTRELSDKCFDKHSVIEVGFSVDKIFKPLYRVCFDRDLMQVLYVEYDQTPANAVHQTRVSRPNTWQSEKFFDDVDLNSLYTQSSQRKILERFVGPALASRYITRTNQRFLAKGHLAAKSDFVFASAQRATFFYINAAPQWQCINAGNWNRLEQNLRARIGAQGYYTVIFTGTFGKMKLPDQNNKLVEIYLSQNKVPVPLYFYKVVHEVKKQTGTAFITINNPYLSLAEAMKTAEKICVDQCRNSGDNFDWLKWEPDRVEIGYSFCCTIEDFRKKIPHLRSFQTVGLLF